MHKQRIQLLRDFLLISEVQRAFKRNPTHCQFPLRPRHRPKYSPNAFEMHWSNFDHVSGFLTLEDAIATASCHACDVQKLGSVDHMIVYGLSALPKPPHPSPRAEITFSTCNADAFGFNLKTEAAFVFPKSGSNAWLHAGWGNLACSVETLGSVALRAWDSGRSWGTWS